MATRLAAARTTRSASRLGSSTDFGVAGLADDAFDPGGVEAFDPDGVDGLDDGADTFNPDGVAGSDDGVAGLVDDALDDGVDGFDGGGIVSGGLT